MMSSQGKIQLGIAGAGIALNAGRIYKKTNAVVSHDRFAGEAHAFLRFSLNKRETR